MTTYRLFPSTSGPATATTYSGNFVIGISFVVTQNMWFDGYWIWCASNSPTTATKFALWSQTAAGSGILVPNSVVTSGTLTASAWNYVPLPTPIQLSCGRTGGAGGESIGAVYMAACGVNGNFAESNTTGSDPAHSFGTGGYTAGITNGPLVCFSDGSGNGGTNPNTWGTVQGTFTTSGSDPSTTMPGGSDHSANFWLDVQLDNTAPTGYSGSYRLYPSYPNITSAISPSNDNTPQTMGVMFSLTQSATLNNVWFYSPSGLGGTPGLPTRTQIWNATTGTLVASTDIAASWSGAVGSGWISNAYTSIVLPAGNYIATVYKPSDSHTFYQESRGWFGNYAPNGYNGPGFSGLTNGPLTSPSQATANTTSPWSTVGGNNCYNAAATVTYPNAYDTGDGGENRWVDVEVTPQPTPTGTVTLALGPLTLTTTGTVSASGTIAYSLGPLTLTATGTVLAGGTGTASLTLGPVIVTSTGNVLGITTGTATLLLGPLTITTFTSNLASYVLGPLTVTSHGISAGGGTLAHTTSTKPRVRL